MTWALRYVSSLAVLQHPEARFSLVSAIDKARSMLSTEPNQGFIVQMIVMIMTDE